MAERYVAIDPRVLDALRAIWIDEAGQGRVSLATARLVIKLATIDPTSGNIVLGVRLHRDLEEGSGEGTSPAYRPPDRPGPSGPDGAGPPTVKGGAAAEGNP